MTKREKGHERALRSVTKLRQEMEELHKDEATAKKTANEISIQLLASKAALVGIEGPSSLPLSMLLATESMRRQPLIDNQVIVSKGLPLLPKRVGQLPNSSIQLATFSPDKSE